MRRAVPAVATFLLLAGPVALAFYSGGYFTEPRLIAAIVTWLLVLALAITGPPPLPRSTSGWLAVAGLALMTAWSAASLAWAPLGGPASENVQRLLLYVGALLIAIGVLRSPRARRAVEPALAGGAAIVIGYGLAGRLLPGLLPMDQSKSAGGRLEQPITYWNSEGLLAAVGLVLCARLAGDRTRPMWLRALAAAATGPLGAGVYLSYSRGAIAACAVGLVVLLAAAPMRSQLRAAVLALAAALVAAGCSAAFPGAASGFGDRSIQEHDGAFVFGIIVVIAVATALLSIAGTVAERRGSLRDTLLPGARWAPAIGGLAVTLVIAGLIVGGLQEHTTNAAVNQGAHATRLASVSSNRYHYWRVGFRAFREHPLQGLGAGGFRVFWLRERPIPEAVKDVHSLELEMAAELGAVGLVAIALLIAGVGLAGRRALRRHPTLAAGPCAAAIVWLLHASIDWDWELPAVSLPVIVLAGAFVALAEAPEHESAPRAAVAPVGPYAGDLPPSGRGS